MCVLCCLTVAGKAHGLTLKGMDSREEPSRPDMVDANEPAPGGAPDQRPATAGPFRLADRSPRRLTEAYDASLSISGSSSAKISVLFPCRKTSVMERVKLEASVFTSIMRAPCSFAS